MYVLQETDASLLSVAGFPAFAVPNKDMRETVTKNVIDILEVFPFIL